MSYEIYSLVWKNKNLHLFEFDSAGLIAFFDTFKLTLESQQPVPLNVIIPTLALVKILLLILKTTKLLLYSLAELVLVFSIQSFFDTLADWVKSGSKIRHQSSRTLSKSWTAQIYQCESVGTRAFRVMAYTEALPTYILLQRLRLDLEAIVSAPKPPS